MTFEVSLSSNPIGAGDEYSIVVTSNEELSGTTIEVLDPNGNKRVINRRKGNSIDFKSTFPRTRLSGEWKLIITGNPFDGEAISEEQTFMVEAHDVKGTNLETDEEFESISDDGTGTIRSSEDSFQDTDDTLPETEEEDEVENLSLDEAVEQESPVEDFTEPVISEEPLTTINGIGNATESKLIEGGFTTINDVANSSIEDLVGAGLQESQAEDIINNAKEFLNS